MHFKTPFRKLNINRVQFRCNWSINFDVESNHKSNIEKLIKKATVYCTCVQFERWQSMSDCVNGNRLQCGEIFCWEGLYQRGGGGAERYFHFLWGVPPKLVLSGTSTFMGGATQIGLFFFIEEPCTWLWIFQILLYYKYEFLHFEHAAFLNHSPMFISACLHILIQKLLNNIVSTHFHSRNKMFLQLSFVDSISSPLVKMNRNTCFCAFVLGWDKWFDILNYLQSCRHQIWNIILNFYSFLMPRTF